LLLHAVNLLFGWQSHIHMDTCLLLTLDRASGISYVEIIFIGHAECCGIGAEHCEHHVTMLSPFPSH
jgi:hypothetical protein